MLTLTNLNKSFGDRPIIKNLSLTIPPQQTLAIVGPSGVGKTTLLRLMSGLETPDSGEIRWDGRPVSPAELHQKGLIGVVFQNFALFPNMSVLRNITLAPTLQGVPAAKSEEDALALLDQLDLHEQADQYPNALSGGQKQRVAIARALILNPQILLYDEPTSALDPALRQNVVGLVEKFKAGGMTQVIVTHDLDFAAQVADQTFALNKQEVSS